VLKDYDRALVWIEDRFRHSPAAGHMPGRHCSLRNLSNLLPGLFESEAARRQLDWFISGHGENDGILRRARGYLACGNLGHKTPSPAGFKAYAVPPSLAKRPTDHV
jgi:hypothetical protein